MINRKVNTCYASPLVKPKQIADTHQVLFSNRVPSQNSIIPHLASGLLNSSYTSDTFHPPTLYLKNESHFPGPKILMNSQVTARYITETELQVNIELKANGNKAAAFDKSTDTNKEDISEESKDTKKEEISEESKDTNEVVVINQAGDVDYKETLSKQTASSDLTFLFDDETVKLTNDAEIQCLMINLGLDGSASDGETDLDNISLCSSDIPTDDCESVGCCSNYSGASNTTYSINTELLSASDFPSSD